MSPLINTNSRQATVHSLLTDLTDWDKKVKIPASLATQDHPDKWIKAHYYCGTKVAGFCGLALCCLTSDSACINWICWIVDTVWPTLGFSEEISITGKPEARGHQRIN